MVLLAHIRLANTQLSATPTNLLSLNTLAVKLVFLSGSGFRAMQLYGVMVLGLLATVLLGGQITLILWMATVEENQAEHHAMVSMQRSP